MARIRLTTDEMAALIRATADNGEVLSAELGGTIDLEANQWAVPLIAEMRGVA